MDIVLEVKQAQQGNHEAFIRLIRHMERQLYRIAKSILKRDEDCADAMQDTIMKSYQALHTLKEPAFFPSWVTRILINECNELLRKRARTVAMDYVVDKAAYAEGYAAVELREAINYLEESLRSVVVLHYLHDMPVKQVANILGIREGTVKTRLHRARQSLAARVHSGNGKGL